MRCEIFAPVVRAPFIEVGRGGGFQFVIVVDHAGRRIPRRLNDLGLPAAELQRHIAWDIGALGVARRTAEALDASLVAQNYSRLVIDCNRDPGHPTSIPPVSEVTSIAGNENLSAADCETRRRAIFDPYHTAIAGILDARADRPTILVAMHSFTPVFKGVARAVEVGVLYHHETPLSRLMLELLRAEGNLTVGANLPYAITDTSDYTVPIHGEGRGIPHVEIEIRQDLIGETVGQQTWAERMARLLTIAGERL